MAKNHYAVIMAGGVGSRFWPVSNKRFPKQFIDMLGTGKSLLQHTFERLDGLIESKNVLVATNADYEQLVQQQLPEIGPDQIITEPAMRNTAPCLLYSALKIFKSDPDACMAVLPSDHWITDGLAFRSALGSALEHSSTEDVLVTFGIRPTHPHTGYGYIKTNRSGDRFVKVAQFTEKPTLEAATSFVSEGNYLWNAGIFIWSVRSILDAFKTWLPEMFALFTKDMGVYNEQAEKEFIAVNYPEAQKVSIDYGIMERAANTVVLPVNFSWNDLGSWSSLHQELAGGKNENVINTGEQVVGNATGNIVQVSEGKKVVIHGIHDYIVVENEDLIFICPKAQEQDIKRIRENVREQFGEDYI
jgi:mannose-1-phosphate guanylyltransferase